jgi:hypothetical protein
MEGFVCSNEVRYKKCIQNSTENSKAFGEIFALMTRHQNDS